MPDADRIYLDHAATSHPKPPGVVTAVTRWFTSLGVSADRGDSARCREVARDVRATRRRMAAMCGVPEPRLVFTSGATDSLNRAFDGLLHDGATVLTTTLEHSSVVRPLHHRELGGRVEVEELPVDACGRVTVERFAGALAKREYDLVVFSHASNVLGGVLDAAAICEVAREHGALTLLDASPTAGLLALDVGADVVIGSAHKGLLAPPGLGFLAARPDAPLRPARFGGTGSSVALDTQPDAWPAAMEPGTPNTPAILGLGAALDFLDSEGRDAILARELALIDELRGLLQEAGVSVYGPGSGPRIPVLSFNVPGFDPAEIGLILDTAGIHVRSGFHCAPHLFRDEAWSSGDPVDGGTVRASVGPFNSPTDIRALSTALPRG